MEFGDLSALIGRTAALHVMLIREGVRQSMRLSADTSEVQVIVRALRATGLLSLVGFDTVVALPTPFRRSFSEWAMRTSRGATGNERVYVYVAKDMRTLLQLRSADEVNDQKSVGGLLEYPACCVEAFVEDAQAIGCQHVTDPVLRRYPHGCRAHWELNVSLLYNDASLLWHVPCGPRCQASLQQARRFFSTLRDIDVSCSVELERRLKTTILHSQHLGIYSLPGLPEPSRPNIVIHEADLTGGPLSGLLRPGVRIECDSEMTWIGDVTAFSEPDAKLFFFH